jgi:hypothetical protein
VPVVGVRFNDPVDGALDAKMSAFLPVGDDVDDATLASYDQALVKHRTWVLAVHPITRRIVWSGILIKRPWSLERHGFDLEFNHVRWWLSRRYAGTEVSAGTYVGFDRVTLARQLVMLLGNDIDGAPRVVHDATLSGKLITFRLEARSFRYMSEVLAEIGAGRNGFEWDLTAEWSPTDNRPQLRFVISFPELKYGSRISLDYNTNGSGNIKSVPDSWPDSAENAVSRVWALGSGTDQNQMIMQDTAPQAAGTGYTQLLTEKTTTYSGTNDRKTLWENARAERIALEKNNGTVSVGVGVDNPDLSTYWKGVRARLQIKDRFLNIDKPNVRVIEIEVNDDTRDQLAEVTLTLDLNDYALPDGLDA